MLKIKDNVQLKELEQYGLKPIYSMKNNKTGEVAIDYLYSTKYENSVGFFRLIPAKVQKILCVYWFNKKIENHTGIIPLVVKDCDFIDIDLLYDLIKVDLVEKVESDE